MVDERSAPRPPFPTSTNTSLDGHLVLAVRAYPVRGVLVDVPFSMLRSAARVTIVTVQPIHLAAPSTHPVKCVAEGSGGGGLGAALEGGGPAEGRCAPAGGAFDGRGGGACEESGAVDGGGDDGLAFGGALYSGRFVPAFRQLRLSPQGRLQVGRFRAWVETLALQLKHHQVSKKPSLVGGALVLGPPSPLGGGGGGAFFESVGGGSVEARAPEGSHQRPEDLDPLPRWVLAFSLGSFSKTWETLCPPSALGANPSTTKTPAIAPVLVVATLAAEPQNSPLSDAAVSVDLGTRRVRIQFPAAIALEVVLGSDMSDTSSHTLPWGSSQTFLPFWFQGPLPLPFSYHV